jgi:putative ABC transport system substrate-binding protein
LRFDKKTILITAIFLFPVFLLTAGCVKKKPKIYSVGILSGLHYFEKTTAGFKEKMGELGYIDGKNIVYDEQKTDYDIKTYRTILKKFISDKVDLIFVYPTEASMEAKIAAQGKNIPVVFANAAIEDTGLVNSIQSPGGNITGVRWPGPDLAVKIFEIMHELTPRAKRMCMPYQKGYPITYSQLKALRPAAVLAGVTVIEAPVSNVQELREYFGAQAKTENNGIEAIISMPEPLMTTPDAFLVACKFAAKYNLPIGGTMHAEGECESIFGVSVNPFAVGKQAAMLADKILKGSRAGSVRVVSSEIYFQFNYKAAKKMGLNVSEGLLSMADEIIR